ncbi:GntR family transcriptional regulator [Paenibacillus radicis (ex Xue et al. 2023)]|uniref:GntR family transcriptional regulator n=1 Tax=Paenibacillus radicis (ex Xue et al. 2023) TaxID=2972489 RepID=A0ABT1YBV1_9BACL|nr:GntR family transcriptional regulator [Paenibacillus radicis (ex Xue et al. 2023)]MCR8630679.1 GntR family transcriptional regulator [Paenibacillus radicis (ex Xue et al. 2023)]
MEFNQKEPIYTQIIDDIKVKLINGTYQLGQEIPSRRELAKTLGVNPNTVQRAYREMEDMKLIITARGQGSFITTDMIILETLREEALNAAVSQSIDMLRSFGKSDSEILDTMKRYLERGTSQ